MYRLLTILSATIGLAASSVSLAQKPEPEFLEYPEVRVAPIDFERIFNDLPDGSGGLIESTQDTSAVMPVTSIEEIEQGPVSLEAVVVENNIAPQLTPTQPTPLATQCDTVTSSACNQCGGRKSCGCRSKFRCLGRLQNCWRRTDLYRLHIQNLGQPGLFCERPFGVCNEGFAGAMIAAGKADQAMLHHFDFIHHADGAVALTTRGRQTLSRIAVLIAEHPVALSIESTLDPNQDAARQIAVVDAIGQLGLSISPDRIRIAVDQTIGLSGEDAQAIHAARIKEVVTGAARTRPYRQAGGATVIPVTTGQSSKR